MKPTKTLAAGLAAAMLSLAALPAVADDDCDVPAAQWQSRDAVRQMAAQQGWQVSRLKIDDGCYELRGTDAQGRRFKATLDPETLTVLRIKHKRGARHEREGRGSAGNSDGGQRAPGDAPRARIE